MELDSLLELEHCIVNWGLNVSIGIVSSNVKLCFIKLKQIMSLTLKNLSLVLVLLKRVTIAVVSSSSKRRRRLAEE